MLLLFSYLFIMLFIYLPSAVYLIIILCTLFTCTSSPLYTHTHTLTRSLSDDLGLARSDIRRFVSIIQVFVETVSSRRARVSPYSILIFLSFLPSYYFLILIISDSVIIPVFIYMISCVVAYTWYCSIHDLLHLGFIIACFGLCHAPLPKIRNTGTWRWPADTHEEWNLFHEYLRLSITSRIVHIYAHITKHRDKITYMKN